MGLKGKQSSGVTGGESRATGSGSESGRPIGGAEQGSAAAVSGRVSYLNDTNLDCGRLSVASERAEETCASTTIVQVQHQILHYCTLLYLLV